MVQALQKTTDTHFASTSWNRAGISVWSRGLIFSVVYLIASVFGKVSDRDFVIVLIIPIIYAVVGLVGGIIAAAIYNLVARWTGGLEFEVGDVPPDG